jgi:hypothetical protein
MLPPFYLFGRSITPNMITKPTTLILGAGASVPFGFPTGYELLNRVLQLGNGVSPVFNSFSLPHVESFKLALSRSGKQSVDAFLEYQTDFIKIGKAAIAYILIQCEQEPALFRHDGKSWYEYLYNQMTTRFDDFDKNKLSILTFNYDRSLEFYLLTALQHSYNKPIEECVEKLKRIPIIHLHGDLGGLPGLENSPMSRYYDIKTTAETLFVARERIKIIHEGFDNATQFRQAQHILADSEQICFLGFGFHPLNMERLGFTANHSFGKKIIRGTTFSLEDAECNQINFSHQISLRGKVNEHSNIYCDILQFLKRSGVLNGN